MPSLGVVALLVVAVAVAGYLFIRDSEINIPLADELMTKQAAQLTKISVIPFESLGPSDEFRYIAQGITTELITDISHLPGLLVVSKSNSPDLPAGSKRREAGLPGADYHISGSVFKMGDQAHITINLMDSRTAEYLWSQRYDVSTLDYFTLRQNITERVVEILSLQLGKQEQARLINRYTDNDTAFDLFLQARLLHSQSEKHNDAAKSLYQQCIDIDPTFGRAYSGLALSYVTDYRYSWGDRPAAALEKAVEMAKIGVSLNPELSEPWEVLAYISLQNKDTEAGVDAIKKALAINSNSADSFAILAGAQINTGHPEEGLKMVGRALKLKAEGGHHFYLLLGRAYYALGHYPQAISALIRSRDFNPHNLDSLVYLYACYQKTGNKEEAAWIRNELLTIKADFDLNSWINAHPLTHRKTRQDLQRDVLGLTQTYATRMQE